MAGPLLLVISSYSLRRFSGRVLRPHLHHRLLPLLAAEADSGEAVDLKDVLKRFAVDNICGIAFGIEGSTLLELGEAAGRGRCCWHDAFFKAFDDAVEISFVRMLHPTDVVWKAMRLAGVGSERRLREAIRVVDADVAAIMESEERSRDNGEDGSAVLSRVVTGG